MKIVISKSYGGFYLSKKALEFLGNNWYKGNFLESLEWRANPKLVECVETLGKEANGYLADLKVVEIPDDVDWQIEEYDGVEWVSEKHRTWE